MPKTKLESIVCTAWMMVYLMTLYNIVLASGTFVNAAFLTVLKIMWVEFVLIFLYAYFLYAYFLSSHVAKHFAFQVVKPTDSPIAILFAIRTFTVVSQVALASILGVYHGYGFTAQFVADYLMTYCRNFIMALPLFLVGPIARKLFRRVNGSDEAKVKQELLREGGAE